MYYQLILWGVFTIFEFCTYVFGLQRPYFTIMTEYALNGRYKLSNWIMGCWFFFRYIMQEILIIQKNNFIQFNYLMFSLTIIVVVSKVATYILQKSLISPKSRLLSRIGSRQTGVPYWFFISLEYLGRCYWHEKGWQIRKLFIKRGTRYVSEGPFLSLTRLNKEIRASRDNRL